MTQNGTEWTRRRDSERSRIAFWVSHFFAVNFWVCFFALFAVLAWQIAEPGKDFPR